ncbi:hypothetical protein GCM10011490_26760 [Pseudoclavibacter endophyticus]|nr:hypothetical protein GCM10011490_26760 [Pseudoclavibacter endophyticus]
MWAMMQKFRMRSGGVEAGASGEAEGCDMVRRFSHVLGAPGHDTGGLPRAAETQPPGRAGLRPDSPARPKRGRTALATIET